MSANQHELRLLHGVRGSANEQRADGMGDSHDLRAGKASLQPRDRARAIVFPPILDCRPESAQGPRPRESDASVVIEQHRHSGLREKACESLIAERANPRAGMNHRHARRPFAAHAAKQAAELVAIERRYANLRDLARAEDLWSIHLTRII